MYRMYQHRSSYIIIKRQINILFVNISLNGFNYICYYLLTTSLSHLKINQIIDFALWICAVLLIIMSISYLLYITRLWLVFYVIMIDIETINNEWQSIIDPTNYVKQYYLSHKAKFGTWQSIKKYFFVYESIYAISVICTFYILLYTNNISLSFIFVSIACILSWIPMSFLWYLLYVLPKHQDNIGLVWEIKLSARMMTILSIISWIVGFVYLTQTALNPNIDHDAKEIDLGLSIFLMAWRITLFGTNMTQTAAVLYKYKSSLSHHTELNLTQIMRATTLDKIKKNTQLQIQNEGLKMKNVLQGELAFDLFMKHCSNGLFISYLNADYQTL